MSGLSSPPERPEVLLKCAMSLDGCFDDSSSNRMVFSGVEDRRAVDLLRASCDAILIGAETLRRDDPLLLLRDSALREERKSKGRISDPIRVVVSQSGNIPRSAKLFSNFHSPVMIYTHEVAAPRLLSTLQEEVEIRSWGEGEFQPKALVSDLSQRGVRRIMLEGGPRLIRTFLEAGMIDTFRIAISSQVLGDIKAPRLSLPFSAPVLPTITASERFDDLLVVSGFFTHTA